MLLTPRGLCGEACHPHTYSTNATQPLQAIQEIGGPLMKSSRGDCDDHRLV